MAHIHPSRVLSALLFATIVASGCVVPAPLNPSNAATSVEGSTSEPASVPVTDTIDSTAVLSPTAEPPPVPTNFEIPEPVSGKFNAAFVFSSPIGDGGWTYAHEQGRLTVEKYLGDRVSTAAVINVPEGPISEVVIRELAAAGFDAIFTCSFGYMDPTATVAEEFPDTFFVHVSGTRKNSRNFGNVFGSMEEMKYLVGMIAGARASEDGSKRVGYIAPFPIPEVIRYVNATALGMRRSCPDCVMDLRWTFSWFHPELEKQMATEMLDSGATVIVTGADTTGPTEVAGERGMWGIGYDSDNACNVDLEHCLTTSYWDWGQVYIWLLVKMLDGRFQGDDYYFDATSNGLGLLGFMIGQEPAPGVPESVIPNVRQVLNDMLLGRYTRFDIFTGPILTNKGELIIPERIALTQSDLEGLRGVRGRPNCTICMNWLVEGVLPELEIPPFPTQ